MMKREKLSIILKKKGGEKVAKFGWFSANEDGEVVAKTDVRDDGTVHRYEYTKEDDVKAGHGHKKYNSMNDFLEDDPAWNREKDNPKSVGKKWYGNGFNLTLEELKALREDLINSQLHTAKELILKMK